ncbi:MAG: Rdx family protein [Acidobacteriaceae bacterium]|nr:Rdx family protein [Acidobacteriaceae bacterium]MBV9305482.1 Rdx family protein [Acidobacteriaceae bacterium]MBV9676103.1 Rdx family protein [Acidobacteriaceae bacterium]
MRLKQHLERELGTPVRVRAGAPGSLQVLLNGEPIYSKKQAGRLPSAEELVALVRGKARAG